MPCMVVSANMRFCESAVEKEEEHRTWLCVGIFTLCGSPNTLGSLAALGLDVETSSVLYFFRMKHKKGEVNVALLPAQ